jgi:hypothetical protein
MFDNLNLIFVAGSNRTYVSGRLALDNQGNIIVMDIGKKRLIQLGAEDLAFVREIVPTDSRLRYAARMFLDATRGRIYVADNELTAMSRLSMSTKFKGKTGRLIIYETKSLD